MRRLSSATVQVGTPGIPANTLVDWLHVASSRVPEDVAVTGVLAGSLAYRPGSGWDGQMVLSDAGLTHGKAEALVVGDVAVHSAAAPAAIIRVRHRGAAQAPAGGFVLAPTLLALGGKEPAVLDGRIDRSGYSLHLTDRKSTRLNSSHVSQSRMPSSA